MVARNNSHNKKGWLIIAAVVAAAAVFILTMRRNKLEAETAHPVRGDIVQTVSAFGRIRPVKEVKISPDVSGEIVEICFDEGESVRKGELLFKIKQDSYLLAIARCEATLGSALKARDAQRCELQLKELEYKRLQQLCENDAAPASQLEQAQIELESATARTAECECQIAAAEASLEAARSELDKTMVYAPMAGTVTSLRVKPGERVVGTSTMAGTEMMTIADLGQMELVVQIGENDICNIKVGDSAKIKPDASPATSLEGTVTRIAVCATGGGNVSSATDFEVRISVDSQDVMTLLPGMSASVVIYTGSKNDILTVPLQAIVLNGGRETVWTVDSRQQVSRRTVECGIQDFSKIEITSGLEESDLVVIGPYQLINKTLKERDKISIGDGFK